MRKFYALFIILILSCNNDNSHIDKSKVFEDGSIIDFCDELNFLEYVGLDSVQTFELSSGHSRFWDVGGVHNGFKVPTLLVYDLRSSFINFYNIETGENYKNINIVTNDGNSVYFTSSPYSSFRVISNNEFVFYDYQSRVLSFVNEEGELFSQIDIYDGDKPLINLSFRSNLLKLGEKYFSLSRPQFDRVLSDTYDGRGKYFMMIDPLNHVIDYYDASLSNLYTKNNYGTRAHNYKLFDGLNKEILINFPVEPSLHKLSLFDFEISEFGEKLKVLNATKPLNQDQINNSKALNADQYYWTNDLYEDVHVDYYNRFYLRVGKKAITEDDYIKNSVLNSLETISFINEFGDNICNCILSNSSGYYIFAQDYLYISNSINNITTDDFMIFHKYKYSNLKNNK